MSTLRRVADIRLQGRYPYGNFTAIGNTLFFLANDGSSGTQIWKADGTTTSRVSDIRPGGEVGEGGEGEEVWITFYPRNFTAVGNTLFFTFNDGSSGDELWKTDGTTTTRVADIRPGASSSEPRYLTAVGNTLFFSAYDGISGNELWKTDGTTTSRVADIRTGYDSSFPRYLTAVGDTVFFSAYDGSSDFELWQTDGTTTSRVSDINPGKPSHLTAVGNTLFFRAFDGTSGTELWKTNGTTTSRVTDIRPGGEVGDGGWGSYYPTNLTAVGNTLFFTAEDGSSGNGLWKTDGTTTSRVAGIRPGESSSYPENLTAVGNTLFFRADDWSSGTELWKTNGITITRVADINPGQDGSYPTNLTAVGNTLFFTAEDGSSGNGLWKTDGTTTSRVADIRTDSYGSYPRNLTAVGNTLFFEAAYGGSSSELWALDIFALAKVIGTVAFGSTLLGYAIKQGTAALIQITYAGTNVSANFPGAGWSGIAAAAHGAGFDLYFKHTNGSYAVWNLNAGGVFTGGSALSQQQLFAAETSLSADLDGDGSIGLSFAATRTIGTVAFGANQLGYALKDGSNRPLSITNAGAVAVAAGGWSALAAVATGSGYDLYWINTNGTYAKWNLNSSAALTNGAVISSADFLQTETSLAADLDGDDKTGLSFGAIKTVGNVQFGNTQLGYALKDGSNTLLSITNAGAVAAATGGWSALAAVATGSGYDLYWINTNGTYAKWNLNSSAALTNGAVISSADFLQTEMSLAADLDGDDKTGLFAIYRGTADNDIITGKGNVSFGFSGNDTLTAGGSSSLGFDILIGGSGSDSYVVPSGKTVIVADKGSSAGDRLNSLGFSFNRTSTTASTLEGGRHLVIDDSSTGSRIYILDWKDATNIIEIVALADATYSFDQMQQKIESLGALPDYSWAQWDSLLGGSELTMLGIASSSAIDNFSAFYRSISGGG